MTYFLINDPDKLVDSVAFRQLKSTCGTLEAARQVRNLQRRAAHDALDEATMRATSMEDLVPVLRDLLQLSKSREVL